MTARRMLLALVALLLAGPACAEVSAVLDGIGQLDSVAVLTNPREGIVWTKVLDTPETQVLNQTGDRFRDLPPTCGILSLPLDDPTRDRVTAPPSQRSAVAIWPRSDGEDYELVFSLWNPELMTWNPTQQVFRATNDLDDLMPWVYVLDQRVYLIWRRAEAWMVAIGKIDAGGALPTIVWGFPATLDRGVLIDGIDFHALALDGTGTTSDQPSEGGRGR